MPIFNDKSVQGIIDKIVAELPCVGSITDKSVQGIIDQASAAGITDKSVQGIIDQLTGFSCGVPFDPTLAFTWTPNALTAYTSNDGAHFNTYISTSGSGYIAGTVTSPPSDLTKNCILLISLRIWNEAKTVLLKQMDLPVLAGLTSRSYSNTWGGSLATVACWDSSQSLNIYTAGAGTYYLMPTIYKSASYVGAYITITGTLNDPHAKVPYETKLNQHLPAGTNFTWDMACAASPVSSSSVITKDRYVGIDLFARYAQDPTGITILNGTPSAAVASGSCNNDASVIFYSGMSNGWNNITNPL